MIFPAEREWLLNELRRLERTPGMYLGADTVGALDLFLNGVMRGRLICGRSNDDETLQEFALWLREQPEFADAPRPAAMGWLSLVESLDDGERNIRTFYSLFRRFLAQRYEVQL